MRHGLSIMHLQAVGGSRHTTPGSTIFRRAALRAGALSLAAAACVPALCAQTSPPSPLCTTQGVMSADMRQGIANTALGIATAIQSNDTARVQSMSAPALAANFDATSYIVRSTAAKIAGNSLRVTQLFRLDASSRTAGDTGEATFSCPLSGSSSEVDFGIAGLPPGIYAFAMVEASGARPWLLAFLLEQQGTAWKVAGFYQHARTAAGHDGLWYWTTARADAKAGQKWRAWVLYGEADQLLRAANFMSSSHLDQLRTERRSNAPPELSEGLNANTPLVIKSKQGAEFPITDLSSSGTEDGKGLDLVVHFRADPLADPVAARGRNVAAAKALLLAHPELREGFTGVSVFADTAGQPPFATQHPWTELQ